MCVKEKNCKREREREKWLKTVIITFRTQIGIFETKINRHKEIKYEFFIQFEKINEIQIDKLLLFKLNESNVVVL